MALANNRIFQMRTSDKLLSQIDDWRRDEADLPPRAEAIRRLVARGLFAAAPIAAVAPPSPPLHSAGAALDAKARPFELPEKWVAAIEMHQANSPWLDSYEKAALDLIERGLDSLDPPENVITIDDRHLAPIRRLAGERPLKQVVLELLDYAVRGYNARQEEIEDEA